MTLADGEESWRIRTVCIRCAGPRIDKVGWESEELGNLG